MDCLKIGSNFLRISIFLALFPASSFATKEAVDPLSCQEIFSLVSEYAPHVPDQADRVQSELKQALSTLETLAPKVQLVSSIDPKEIYSYVDNKVGILFATVKTNANPFKAASEIEQKANTQNVFVASGLTQVRSIADGTQTLNFVVKGRVGDLANFVEEVTNSSFGPGVSIKIASSHNTDIDTDASSSVVFVPADKLKAIDDAIFREFVSPEIPQIMAALYSFIDELTSGSVIRGDYAVLQAAVGSRIDEYYRKLENNNLAWVKKRGSGGGKVLKPQFTLWKDQDLKQAGSQGTRMMQLWFHILRFRMHLDLFPSSVVNVEKLRAALTFMSDEMMARRIQDRWIHQTPMIGHEDSSVQEGMDIFHVNYANIVKRMERLGVVDTRIICTFVAEVFRGVVLLAFELAPELRAEFPALSEASLKGSQGLYEYFLKFSVLKKP